MRGILLIFGLAAALVVPGLAGQPQRSEEAAGRAERHPGNAIDRWNKMSPEQRERELAKLPPERARQIRERIRRYNQLPAHEKQVLREDYQTFAQLPAERQEIVRQRMREFRQLPEARRPLVRSEYEALRAMPEAQRHERLNSEEFRTRFSPQEQQIIRDVTENFAPNPQ